VKKIKTKTVKIKGLCGRVIKVDDFDHKPNTMDIGFAMLASRVKVTRHLPKFKGFTSQFIISVQAFISQ